MIGDIESAERRMEAAKREFTQAARAALAGDPAAPEMAHAVFAAFNSAWAELRLDDAQSTPRPTLRIST